MDNQQETKVINLSVESDFVGSLQYIGILRDYTRSYKHIIKYVVYDIVRTYAKVYEVNESKPKFNC